MPRRTMVATAGLAILFGACGGDGAGTGSLADGLALIPDSPGNRAMVVIEDIAAVREGADISRPTSTDELVDYLMTVTQGPVTDRTVTPPVRSPAVRLGAFMQPFQNRFTDLDAWQEEMGLTIADLDMSMLGGMPPDELIVWMGSLDPAEIADAVETDPAWSSDLRRPSHSGTDYWCWTDDPSAASPDRRTAMRPLGRGGCLAAFDGVAYRTISPEVMRAALEVRADDADSLADVEALRIAADALDAYGAYGATFTMEAEAFAAQAQEAREVDLASLDQPLPGRWEALAAGGGFDEEGEYLVLVLVYPDEAAAAENAVTLTEIVFQGQSATFSPGLRWIPGFAEGVRPITTEGRAVVAVLEGAAISLQWNRVAALPDTLTIWEE